MTWKTVLLGDLAEFRNGINYDKTSFGQGLKVIGVADFQDYTKPRYEKLNEIKPEGVVKDEDILKEQDILFVRSNGNKELIGRSMFIDTLPEPVTFSGFSIRARFKTAEAVPRFYAYLFRSDIIRKTLTAHGGGTNIANLNQRILSRLEVPFPPQLTQQRIADILTAYDDLIDNNTRRIALLEESIHRLYQEWFVYLRFPGCDRVKVVDGVPEGWEKMPFGDALILQRGFDLPHKDRKRGSIPVYASTGINGFHNVAKVKAPGIVTGRSGSLGSVMYIQQDFWALNTTLWVKEFKQVTVPFAYFLLSNLDLASYQGGSAVPTLNRNAVHAVEITVPDMNIQQKFDEIVHPAFKQIETFNRYNEKLREARDLLLPRLMNGSLAV